MPEGEQKQDQWLSITQIAERLNVDKETIRKLCVSGQIQASKVGDQWRIRPSALETYLGQSL